MAKLTPEEKQKLLNAIELLRAVAKALVQLVMSEPLETKDNYAKVLAFMSGMEASKLKQQLFLLAMIKEGYPKDTAMEIANILGLNSIE